MTVITQTILKADAGKRLTNGTLAGEHIILGDSDSIENWREEDLPPMEAVIQNEINRLQAELDDIQKVGGAVEIR